MEVNVRAESRETSVQSPWSTDANDGGEVVIERGAINRTRCFTSTPQFHSWTSCRGTYKSDSFEGAGGISSGV